MARKATIAAITTTTAPRTMAGRAPAKPAAKPTAIPANVEDRTTNTNATRKAAAKSAPVTAPDAAPAAFNATNLAASATTVAAMPSGGGGTRTKANPFAAIVAESYAKQTIHQVGPLATESNVNSVKNLIRKAAKAINAKATIRTVAVDGGWQITFQITTPDA